MSDTVILKAGESMWLTFGIGDQLYAAPLSEVNEVVRDADITPVPGAAPEILGIRHLRGRIVPVIEGRARLGLDQAPVDADAVRVVMLAHGGHMVGVRVDRVSDLMAVNAEHVELPPPGGSLREDEPVDGVYPWQGTFVALLNVRRLCRLPAAQAA